MGFIDLHCHLLPGLDDGPSSWEAAGEMCRQAAASGTVALAATPHHNHRWRHDPDEAAGRRDRLAAEHPGLRLVSGCEVLMSLDTLPEVLACPRRYTLAGGRYLLVELMPGALAPNLEGVFARLLDSGVVPVLAHPERYPHLLAHPRRLSSWVEAGCLAQLTADALTGRMGRRLQSISVELIRRGLAHLVASDAHDPFRRPPRLDQAWRAVETLFSTAVAARLFLANSCAVLEDRPLGEADTPRAHSLAT